MILEELKKPLFLVEYVVDGCTPSVWYWETELEEKMSPTFHDRDKAMDWMEEYEERD